MNKDVQAGLAAIASVGWPMPSGQKDPLEGVDIAAEYELIQQKKSTLSSNLRRLVVLRHSRSKEYRPDE